LGPRLEQAGHPVSGAVEALFAPSPLLLAPMGLQYRVIPESRLPGCLGLIRSGFNLVSPPPRQAQEIRFRWQFGDDFSQGGIEPPDAHETAALAAFRQTIGSASWFAVDQQPVEIAWRTLVRSIRPGRALHFLRNPGAAGAGRAGKITMMSAAVAIFAADSAGAAIEIGRGAAITGSPGYDLAALQPGGWLTSFQAAVDCGMGCVIGDSAMIDAALDAEWVIAIGLYDGDASSEIEALIRDGIANGRFEFLARDTPTNNIPGAPSAMRSPLGDLVSYVRGTTDFERAPARAPSSRAAEKFAEALGIAPSLPRGAPGADGEAFDDARAMMLAIGPALLDAWATGQRPAVAQAGPWTMATFLADWVSAGGPLPTVRFGRNPYGVLPLTMLAELDQRADDPDQVIEADLAEYALAARQALLATPGAIPIAPGDPDAGAKLAALLKLSPVSRKLLVTAPGAAGGREIACPLVAGPGHDPASYIAQVRNGGPDLVDPDKNDTSHSVLYRLLLRGKERLDFERLVASSLHGGTPFLWTANAPALERLEALAAAPGGERTLETLMMETLDLFQQNRGDAYGTGVAHRRTALRRRAGTAAGLSGGYWGVLGKLRPSSVTGGSDGYIQAPSPDQARTAMLLRAAHLRQPGQAAFKIGLTSERVRRGLKLLDQLGKGSSLSEILGRRGERWLHEQQADRLIAGLRTEYPFQDPNSGTAAIEIRLFNGRQFLRYWKPKGAVPYDDLLLGRLKAALSDDLDVLADLVMTEAVSERVGGRIASAHAWQKVLSGYKVPGRPDFVRTRRYGHSSSHRVTLLTEPFTRKIRTSPRVTADPTVAAMAEDLLKGFQSASVTATIPAASSGGAPAALKVYLASDLMMRPVDLVYGGMAEVEARVRNFAARRWRKDVAIQVRLGPPPAAGIDAILAGPRPMGLTCGTAMRTLAAAAADFRLRLQRARPLEPSDLNAAAAAGALDEPAVVQMLNGAAALLRDRAARLGNRLAYDLGKVRTAFTTASFQALDSALVEASRYCEPSALRPLAPGDSAARPEVYSESIGRIIASLDAKAARLAAVSTAPVTAPATAAAARETLAAIVSALQATLDGEGFMVMPSYARTASITPDWETSPARKARLAAERADWAAQRPRLAGIAAFAASAGLTIWDNSDAATGVDSSSDARPENIAPKSHHYGAFLVPHSWNPAQPPKRYCGLVVDEWAEQRPSEVQTTGIGFSYETPPGAAPNCLLLCEPPNDRYGAWTEPKAVAMVLEALAWTKARARPTPPLTDPPTLAFVDANQVADKDGVDRIPVITGIVLQQGGSDNKD
jgi:hypothetical protein